MTPRGRFIIACKKGDLKGIKQFAPTAVNNFAIREASYRGYLPVVKYLVKNGVDVIVNDNSPICSAAIHGHLSVVKYLVENGADLTAKNNFAIRSAARYGHWSMVKYLYLHGAPEKYVPAKLLAEIKAEIALRRVETRRALLLNKCMCVDVVSLVCSYVT